jgi:DNA polymerase-3 subunit beta
MEATATCSISAAPKALVDDLAAVKPAVGTRSAVQALTGVRIFTKAGVAYAEANNMQTAVRRRLSAAVHGELDTVVPHGDLAKAAKLFVKRESIRLEPAPRVVRTFTSEHDVEAELRTRGHHTLLAKPWEKRGWIADSPAEVLAWIDEVEAVMALPPETIDDLRVTDGKRTIELRSLRMADWPAFPAGDETPLFNAPSGAELSATLLRAARFASSDDTRPVLTGIGVHYGAERIRLWATDSYRLCDIAAPAVSMREPDAEQLEKTQPLVNVPAAGLVMAAKAMKKSGAVTASTTKDHAVVRFGDEVWAVRMIDGQFPNFRQLVPDHHDVEVTMPLAELAGACDVAVAFARRNAPMRFAVNGQVKVTGVTPDVCEFEELLPGATYTTPGRYMRDYGGMEVGLSPEFVRDIAQAHIGDTATLRLISPLRPALFVEGDDIYLQMPIRLNV